VKVWFLVKLGSSWHVSKISKEMLQTQEEMSIGILGSASIEVWSS
jgi:hypothetical protein